MKVDFRNIFSIFIFFTVFFTVPNVWADYGMTDSNSIIYGLPEDAASVLEREGQVYRFDEEGDGLLYLPDSVLSSRIKSLHSELAPEITVEAFFKVQYPAEMTPGRDTSRELYNLSRKVSTFEGVQYYSATRKKYDTLFKKAYRISSPDSRTRIEDPEPVAVPFDDSVYLFMQENSMGKSTYRLDYQPAGDELMITLTNEENLGILFKVVYALEMKVSLIVIPCSDCILIYGYCGAVLQNDELVKVFIDPYDAFYRRMSAMETWFYNNLHETSVLPPQFEVQP